MAKIGFLTLYAAGHVGPTLTLAKALAARGHDAVFFNVPDVIQAVNAAGVQALAYGEQEYPVGSLRETMRRTAELSGPAAFAHYVERMAVFFRCGFAELPDLLAAERLDLLVVDQVHYAGSTLAERVGVPFISLANALLVNREPMVPPPVMLWPYENSAAAAVRNGKGWEAVDAAYRPLLQLVNSQREEWGMVPLGNLLEDSFSPIAQLCQQPDFFDFPRLEMPESLLRLGPFREQPKERENNFPWEWLDGRPLVYGSCGTLQNRLEHVFRAMIDACAGMEVQAVIALGNNALTIDQFGQLPENVKLLTFAPQRALLARAAACITHAGLNTVLDCLEFGVPMVAIPIASEQPGIAMRVTHLGAGVAVPLADVSTERVAHGLSQVLGETRYLEAAREAAARMATIRPLEQATAVIEQLVS